MLVGAWEGEARCFYISFSGYWGSAASIEILHGARKVWIKRRTRHASCRHIAEVVVVKEDAAFSEIYWELGVETRLRWKHKRKVPPDTGKLVVAMSTSLSAASTIME